MKSESRRVFPPDHWSGGKLGSKLLCTSLERRTHAWPLLAMRRSLEGKDMRINDIKNVVDALVPTSSRGCNECLFYLKLRHTIKAIVDGLNCSPPTEGSVVA